MTIVLTSHYLEEAEALCDRVAIIHAGEIVALDTPASLLAGLGGELLELRVHGDVSVALAALGAHGVAANDALVVGSTLTVPCTRRPPPRRSPRFTGRRWPRARSAAVNPPSTTSTCD